jgi:hypothetical protein
MDSAITWVFVGEGRRQESQKRDVTVDAKVKVIYGHESRHSGWKRQGNGVPPSASRGRTTWSAGFRFMTPEQEDDTFVLF